MCPAQAPAPGPSALETGACVRGGTEKPFASGGFASGDSAAQAHSVCSHDMSPRSALNPQIFTVVFPSLQHWKDPILSVQPFAVDRGRCTKGKAHS